MQRIDITQLKDGSFSTPQITIDGMTLPLSEQMSIEIMKAVKQTNAYQVANKTADNWNTLTNTK